MKRVPDWFLFGPIVLFIFMYIFMTLVFSQLTDRHTLPVERNLKAIKARLEGDPRSFGELHAAQYDSLNRNTLPKKVKPDIQFDTLTAIPVMLEQEVKPQSTIFD